jgi:hypothetical protein
MVRRNLFSSRKSVAVLSVAASTLGLTTAGLATGAERIDNSRPGGRVRVVTAKLWPASALAAGDRVQRVLDLKTAGRRPARLIVTADRASPLTDPKLGMRLKIERCPKAWRAKSRVVFTCQARTTVSLPDGPAVGVHKLRKLSANGNNHLRLILTLPPAAANALQGQSAALVYSFR